MHVRYICLHLPYNLAKSRHVCHTWILWVYIYIYMACSPEINPACSKRKKKQHLRIQSPCCQMMIGVSFITETKRKVFRFHETILSFGDWIPRDCVFCCIQPDLPKPTVSLDRICPWHTHVEAHFCPHRGDAWRQEIPGVYGGHAWRIIPVSK